MKKSIFNRSILGLMFLLFGWLAACSSAASDDPAAAGSPSDAAASLLPAQSPAGDAATPLPVADMLAPLKDALDNYQQPLQDRDQVIVAMQETVAAILSAAPQPLTHKTITPLLAELQSLLPAEQPPVTAIADLDQDGQPDLTLGLPQMYGIPAFSFLSSQGYGGRPLPPGSELPADNLADDFILNAWPSTAQAEDVTGDDRPEILVNYTLPGASGVTDRLYTFRWLPETQTFEPIFQATLITWAAESTWQLESGPAGSRQFLLQGPAFGVFSHKLLPHPTLTQRWQWAGAGGRFVKVEQTISAPQTPRQQFNKAEALLRRGNYEEAAAEFQEVAAVTPPPNLADMEDQSTDWVALAYLRLGQTYALLGQMEAARAELAQAQAAGGTIGKLATAFLNSYHSQEDLIPAWAALMNEVDLAQLLYNEAAGNLGFPVSAFDINYPGLAVAAYLDRHPEVTTAPTNQPLAGLQAQHFPLMAALFTNITPDAQPDLIFITSGAASDPNRLWLAHYSEDRWRVELLDSANELRLEETIMLPDGGNAITVSFPSETGRPTVAYGWQMDHPVVYSLAGEIPQIQSPGPWPTIGGGS